MTSAASDGEALEQARLCNPDLALLDVMLPDLDAFEVIQRLRALVFPFRCCPSATAMTR
ncbi:hypothetical protein [Saccharopolyspora antimicrobica]|uniref:hypothetical protein n=1 Tax=Saccharopolyspora antimicrobica TaxID=455193 RepID=UPI001476CAA4|nr:hypothetical protein [Saccharopolyspora antimicrobica]